MARRVHAVCLPAVNGHDDALVSQRGRLLAGEARGSGRVRVSAAAAAGCEGCRGSMLTPSAPRQPYVPAQPPMRTQTSLLHRGPHSHSALLCCGNSETAAGQPARPPTWRVWMRTNGKRRSTGQNSTLWVWLALPPADLSSCRGWEGGGAAGKAQDVASQRKHAARERAGAARQPAMPAHTPGTGHHPAQSARCTCSDPQ